MSDRTTPKRIGTALGALACVMVACGGTLAGGDGGTGSDGGNVASGGGARVDGAFVSYGSCAGPGWCELVPLTCCGKCGVPALGDMIAVNYNLTTVYRNDVCKGGTIPCPDCAAMDDPNLTAVCRQSTCRAVDVRTDTMSGCTVDDDCVLRAGNGCCESCAAVSPAELIALSKTGLGELQSNVCHPDQGACPPCVPQYPPNVVARCDPQTRHCFVK